MSKELDKHIKQKYTIEKKLGEGAYGVVYKAFSKKYKRYVALKKIIEAFRNETDAQRTYREVMFLLKLRHDHIVQLYNIHKAKNDKDLYLVFEYMDSDLHATIRMNVLQEIHRQYIIYQVLKTIKYIHSADVIHRDLKPSNILLNSDARIKLADFGLARSISAPGMEKEPIYTDYVATRWYRAPEILLGATQYTKAIDMWSIGCILAEMLLGRTILPGNSTLNQLERIITLIGYPSQEDLREINSPYTDMILRNIHVERQQNFEDVFPNANKEAVDLVKKLLVFNPKKRLTAEEALKHPYLKAFHRPNRESVCEHKIMLHFDDDKRFTVNDYRDRLYHDIKLIKKKRKEEILAYQMAQKNCMQNSNSDAMDTSV